MDETEKPEVREDANTDVSDRKPYQFPSFASTVDDQPLIPENTDDSPDVHFTPIAAGCGASCAASLVLGLIIIMALSAAGVDVARNSPEGIPPLLTFLGFFAGLGTVVLAGYVAARTAPNAKRLHAFILGIIMMVLSMGSIAIVKNAVSLLPALAHIILDIPLACWGAAIAIAQDER